jgi:two-component system cell cycle response regulator
MSDTKSKQRLLTASSATQAGDLGKRRPDQTLRINGEEVEQIRQPQTGRRGSLLIIDGDPADIGNHVVVESEAVIGREPAPKDDSQRVLQLRDWRCSRRHAHVALGVDGTYWLHDMGSTNGTVLNGHRLQKSVPLDEGDQIYVGKTLIKFTLVDDAEAAYLQRMSQLAGTDELTGLLAKHRFDSLLSDAVRAAHAHARALAVLMMDLDNLKKINDAHGHQMGASTIRQVGYLIGEIIAGRGEACRFGGDEFSAFLPGLPLDRAVLVGERIRATVERESYCLGATTVRASISVGVAVLVDGITSGEQLLERADQALYRAKAAGRNTVMS